MRTSSRHLKHAVINLTASKLRALLAVLGILIGTAAVVALLTSGKLATEKALSEFKMLGTDLLAVTTFSKNQHTSAADKTTLSLKDWREIPAQVPGIQGIAPYAAAFQNMSFNGMPLQGSIIGADESLAQILNITLGSGHFVSFVQSSEQYCVIGHQIAMDIRQHHAKNPLGQHIRIGALLYTIIGVANPWPESAFFNQNINQSVIIPIAGMPLISQNATINSAVLKLHPNAPIEPLIERVKTNIARHAPDNMILTRSAKQMIASMENQGKTFTLLLAVIGAISLLVGGIGVMNVMLVSVTERKKEIGIRKALGATQIDIQALFLTESVVLSLIGGTLGILAGLLLTAIIAVFSGWDFKIFPLPPIMGFSVSVLIGIFFGYYPARQAAKLDPILCLRQD